MKSIAYLYHQPPDDPLMRMPEVDHRRKILRQFAGPDIRVDIKSLPDEELPDPGSYSELDMQSRRVIELADNVHEQYDAMVIGCYIDPGFKEARQCAGQVPLIGPGRASLIAASILGQRIAVITSGDEFVSDIKKLIGDLEFDISRYSVHAMSLSTYDLQEDLDHTKGLLLQIGKEAKRQNAQVLVFGCMTLGFIPNLSLQLQSELGIPIVNPVCAGIRLATMLCLDQFMPSQR